MKRWLACSVIVVALFAMALTRPAGADVQPEGAPTGATPLQVRAAKPLALEPAPSTSGWVWKLLAVSGAVGLGAWLWSRRVVRPVDASVPELRILGRTSAGLRCELLLVELGDQRLLLGVTPHSIQNLYIIPEAGSNESEAQAASTGRNGTDDMASDIEGQARGLLSIRARP